MSDRASLSSADSASLKRHLQDAGLSSSHHHRGSSHGGTTSGKKRSRDTSPRNLSPVPDVLFQTAAIQASQVCSKLGYHGLAQVLMSKSAGGSSSGGGSGGAASAVGASGHYSGADNHNNNNSTNVAALLPTVPQVIQAATKAHQEQPPWIHWSKSDMAHASLRVTSGHRLALQGNLTTNSIRAGGGGYRMARASAGCSVGSHYFEIWVLDDEDGNKKRSRNKNNNTVSHTNDNYNSSNNNNKVVPTTADILQALPPTVRLAPALRRSLQANVEYEELIMKQQQQTAMPSSSAPPRRQLSESEQSAASQQQPPSDLDSSVHGGKRAKLETTTSNKSESDTANVPTNTTIATTTTTKHHRQNHHANNTPPRRTGGHLRVGWSMRTGELQAPVGYDRWSFAIRDVGGSIITNSQRIDNWVGAEGFGPGDVIGCAISLEEEENNQEEGGEGSGAPGSNSSNNKNADGDYNNNNSIRFFKNGICMGEFVIAKGKRSGGKAPFGCDIPAGTYYPAVSCYLGGACRANFGPKFLYPPRKLPAGLKLSPLCETQAPPETNPQVVMAQMAPILKLLRTGGWKNPDLFQQKLKECVQAEARLLKTMYDNYHRQNLMEIRKEREDRGMAMQDLESLLEEGKKGV